MSRVVIAPDKFKGSLTAAEVCDALATGLRRVDPDLEVHICPVADGGDGTMAAATAAGTPLSLSGRPAPPVIQSRRRMRGAVTPR